MPQILLGTSSQAMSQLQPTQVHTRASQGTKCFPTHDKVVKLNQDSMELSESRIFRGMSSPGESQITLGAWENTQGDQGRYQDQEG